jgi:hypothetical protein
MADMRQIKLAEYVRHAALVAVFSMQVAVWAGVAMQAMLYFGALVYKRRVIGGGIRHALAALGALVGGGTPTGGAAGAVPDGARMLTSSAPATPGSSKIVKR